MSSLTSIANLPRDLIIEIFKQVDDPLTLGKMEIVCKNWKQILDNNPQIWRAHLAEVPSSLRDVKNPKAILISRLKHVKPYIDYPDNNGEISSNNILRGLIEVVPFGRIFVGAGRVLVGLGQILVAAVWNYRNR